MIDQLSVCQKAHSWSHLAASKAGLGMKFHASAPCFSNNMSQIGYLAYQIFHKLLVFSQLLLIMSDGPQQLNSSFCGSFFKYKGRQTKNLDCFLGHFETQVNCFYIVYLCAG